MALEPAPIFRGGVMSVTEAVMGSNMIVADIPCVTEQPNGWRHVVMFSELKPEFRQDVLSLAVQRDALQVERDSLLDDKALLGQALAKAEDAVLENIRLKDALASVLEECDKAVESFPFGAFITSPETGEKILIQDLDLDDYFKGIILSLLKKRDSERLRIQERASALWALLLRLPDPDYQEQTTTAHEARRCYKEMMEQIGKED
jgi:hypothetical protein